MRTRIRNVSYGLEMLPALTVPYTVQHCGGTQSSGTQVFGPTTVITSGLNERMDDGLGRGKSNTVTHRRMTFTVSGDRSERVSPHAANPAGVAYFSGAGAYRASLFRNISASWFNWDPSVPNYFTSLPHRWTESSGPVNETSMKNDVIEQAKQLKADVLLNICEASQLWPSIKSVAVLFNVLLDKTQGDKALKRGISTLSGAYLAYKFGLAPIVSDLRAIVKYLPKMADDLRRHRTAQRRRFSKVALVPMQYDASPVVRRTIGAYQTDLTTSQGRMIGPSELRYVLVTEPALQYETALFSAFDLAMRRFASSPASLAWERTPFSFMLDWFVDLRGVANAVDRTLGFAPFKTVSFTRSRRYEVASDTRNVAKSPCNGATLEDRAACTLEYRHYERSLASASAMPVWKPRFGKTQAGITAALIAQVLFKRAGKWSRNGS